MNAIRPTEQLVASKNLRETAKLNSGQDPQKNCLGNVEHLLGLVGIASLATKPLVLI